MGSAAVRRYTPEEIDRALLAYMVTGENAPRTLELLAASGVDDLPSTSTLHKWANTLHADRYAQLQTEQAPKVAERIASQAEALALRFADLERKLADRLEQDLEDGKVKDVSGALRNVSTSKALQIDKLSSPLRGRPTVITGHLDPSESINALARRLGIQHVLDGTAEELPA